MQPISSTKPLVEGAFAAALSTMLALVGLYIPLLSGITNMVWTIPITILVARYSLRYGLMTLAVTTFMLVMLSNPITAGFYVVQFGMVGVFFGVVFRRQLATGYAVLGGVVISIISTAVVSYLSLRVMGLTLGDLDQQLMSSVDSAVDFYRSAGILERYAEKGITEDMLRESASQIMYLTKRLMPGILVFGAAAAAGINFLASHMVALRLRIPVRALRPFSEWQMPWYLTWGVVLGFAVLLLGDYLKLDWLVMGGQNILLIYSPVLLLFGISVLSHYYQKSQLPRWLKIGIIVLSSLYFWITLIVIMTIGLFDPFFNYRKHVK